VNQPSDTRAHRSDPAAEGSGPSPTGVGGPAKSGTIDPEAFMEAFRRNRYSPTATAAELGMPRTTIYSLMERHPEMSNVNAIPTAELRRQHEACGGDLDRLADRLGVSRRGLQIRLSQIFKEGSRRAEGPRGGVDADLDE
jgi:two-component system, NtrC family, nitrogen regulation response regulator GlnG